jgi:hypothetical protein
MMKNIMSASRLENVVRDAEHVGAWRVDSRRLLI